MGEQILFCQVNIESMSIRRRRRQRKETAREWALAIVDEAVGFKVALSSFGPDPLSREKKKRIYVIPNFLFSNALNSSQTSTSSSPEMPFKMEDHSTNLALSDKQRGNGRTDTEISPPYAAHCAGRRGSKMGLGRRGRGGRTAHERLRLGPPQATKGVLQHDEDSGERR